MNSLSFKQALKIFAVLFLSLACLRADPTGAEILAGVKTLIQTQNAAVTGKLRTGPKVVPFTLSQADGQSVYRFQNPDQTIRIAFNDSAAKLTGVDDPKKPVRDSIVTYDDLALRFLYWQDI